MAGGSANCSLSPSCLVFSCETDRIKPKPSLILLSTRHDHVAYFRYSLSEVNDSFAVERLKKTSCTVKNMSKVEKSF